jgi:hypothetical protein
LATASDIERSTRKLLENDAEHAKGSDVSKVLAVLNEQNSLAAKPSKVEVTFRKDDGRLKFLGPSTEDVTRLFATLDGVRVICVPSLTNETYYNSQLPRHMMIYSKISAMTLVQSFYGIAEIATDLSRVSHRAVMEDLTPYQSLEQAIHTKSLPEDLQDRLKIAFELSKTIAYLHSVQVLVKNMTGANIFLRPNANGGVEPVLTNLEQARLVR